VTRANEAHTGLGMTVGVVGTGNMGAAMVRGWLRALPGAPDATGAVAPGSAGSPAGLGGILGGDRLLIWDKSEEAVRSLLGEDLVSVAPSLEALIGGSHVVVIVVKPKDAREVLTEAAGLLRSGQVVVSAMGGLTLSWLRGILGPGPSLCRVMPNLGVALGAGAIAFAAEPQTSADTTFTVKALLQPLGLVEEVPEALFDVVTAVSGSGPAFLALAIEGVEDGAVAAGLGRSAARALIRQSVLDMARRLAHHSYSAAELKEHLLRGGSMTPAVMKILDDREIGAAFRQAVAAAMARSREMGRA